MSRALEPAAADGERYELVLRQDATVSRCRDRRVGREVIVKGAAAGAAPFLEEASIQARLEHPCVIPVYDVGADAEGRPFFTMRAASGETLASIARRLAEGDPEARREFPRHRLLAIFSTLCLAVEFVHARGYVHGALSADRVLVGTFGEVYLLEWDHASRADDAAIAEEVRALARILATLPEGGELTATSAADLSRVVVALANRDRQAEHTQRLAEEHLARARTLLGGDDADARAAALGEVGRALALTPDGPEARRLLVTLLASPPTVPPAEARAELDAQNHARLRKMEPTAAWIYAVSWFVVFPVIAWFAGIRDLREALLPSLVWCFTSVIIVVNHRYRLYVTPVSYSAIGVMAGVAATTLIIGPFFMLPVLGAATIMGHMLVDARSHRPSTVLMAILALLVPTVLAYTGVHPVYAWASRTLEIRGAISMRPAVLFAGLTVCHLVAVVFAAHYAIRYRDALDAATLGNALFRWQLSRIVADETPRATPDLGEDLDGPSPPPEFGPQTSSPELGPGRERYEVRALLGEGGMGEVLLCHDGRIGRNVAMKLVRHELRRDPGSTTRFLREARVQAILEHPAIVPLYDLGQKNDGRLYFTMKVVRGPTLADVLGRLRREERTATRDYPLHRRLQIFVQICLAVQFAHERGVVHRDLKPSNIMLGRFGEVYVLDWGVARTDEAPVPSSNADGDVPPAATRAGVRLGTPGYMAPEQAAGNVSAIDARADVFSLGAILFAIVALEPLMSETEARAYVRGKPVALERRPSVKAGRSTAPELDAICVTATADDPAARFASARELERAVDRFLRGDRDLALRQRLAAAHLAAARTAATTAFAGDADARARALREVGVAVALAPDDREAIKLLLRLLTSPPASIPAEVAGEVRRMHQTRARNAGAVGALACVMWVTVFPAFAFATGPRSPWAVVAIACAWGMAGWVTAWQNRASEPSDVPWPTFATMLAIASTTLLAGPLLVMPVLAVVYVMGHLLTVSHRWRGVVLALGIAVIVVPTWLAWSGVHSVYALDTAKVTFGGVLEGPDTTPTYRYVGLTLIHLSAILLGARFTARFRDALDLATLASLVNAWQLSKLIPQSTGRGPDKSPPGP